MIILKYSCHKYVTFKAPACWKLSKKTLSFNEKVKFLDFAKGNSNFGCRKLAEIFKIGKTAVTNILKEEKSNRNQH